MIVVQERHRIKKLLAQEEAMVPALFYNMRRALLPLMDDACYDVMGKIVSQIEAREKSKEEKKRSRGGQQQPDNNRDDGASHVEVDGAVEEDAAAAVKKHKPCCGIDDY